jgi:glycosyltransferase involved in cell wall biosynthesis
VASPKKLGICHVAHGDLWAGAEVHLVTLLEGLLRLDQFDISAILFNEGRLTDELRSLGIPVFVLNEKQYSALGILAKLTQHIRNKNPDIVHTHKYKDNILACIAATALKVQHVVRIVHGMAEPFRGREYTRMIAYRMLDDIAIRSRVSKLIAVSANIESKLGIKYGFSKVVCIRNGINLDKVRITSPRQATRARLGVDPNAYLVGTVGRLAAVKGHEFLLQAASLPQWNTGLMQYLIVGDGPLMPSLRALAARLGIEKQVILAGHRNDIYDLIAAMDAFVLPSLHEGIPMVLLEALALDRPVIASRVGGIPEVIEHGVNGLLVAPASPVELHAALNTLMHDSSYSELLGLSGRRRVENEYSATLMVKRTAALYASLC